MPSQLAPATLEGWFALHQMFALDWAAVREGVADALAADAAALFESLAADTREGWSEPVRLVGAGGADFMFIHFRPSLEELAEVQRVVASSRIAGYLSLAFE
jgi:chlorite dismutase